MSCAVADRSRRRERTADLPREPLAALPETVAPAPLSTECLEAVRALVAQIELRIDGLADRMAREIQTAIPEVDQGPGLLEATRASCRANLIIVFGRMREGVDPHGGGVPAEALEYMLAFVRHGVSLATLLRTYRIDHALVLRTLLDLAVERLDDRTVLGHVVQHCNWYTYAYIVSPVPSNTRFEAAGLSRVPLAPLLAAFGAGRLVSYSVSLLSVSAAQGRVREVIAGGVSSPKAIAFGLLGLVGLVVFVRVDWISVIDRVRAWDARRRGRPAPPSIREQIQARS